MLRTILGWVGILWGGVALTSALVLRSGSTEGAAQAGRTTGLVLAALMLVAGLRAVFGSRSK